MKKNGFTLIELMIVISIIAILTLVGVASYTQVLKNGRDGKRQTDLKILQSDLEQYRADLGFYPSSTILSNALILANLKDLPFTNQIGRPAPTGSVKVYRNKTPFDNNNTTPYVYKSFNLSGTNCDNSSANRCMTFCLYTQLESGGQATLTPAICNTNKPSSYNFVVTPP